MFVYSTRPYTSYSGACKDIPAAVIEGKRLVLVPFDESVPVEDSVLMHQYSCLDEDLYALMPFDAPETHDIFRNTLLLENWTHNPTRLPFVIRDRANNSVVGLICYLSLQAAYKTIEIGQIWTAGPYQGQKVALEATHLLMRYAMDQGFVRIEWKTHHLNEASKAAALSAGFIYEGTFRKHMFYKGQFRHTFYYAIIDDDYDKVKAIMDEKSAQLLPLQRRNTRVA
ncbi:acyl-CoA N-acyltransferase [Polychytrium aggregatum]|uniref:acyl-CoA N-acyltransferase n=1 Tax=Polychytrium aggregatum TaxID=110093 RepID=UPI0022FE0749|nr:acyl-CoA N-acyltransferase [Polychytrium aggregatum]KAI9205652.1 acyl-CoA N-acyltransferase [Polychytrium aggregatum]